MSVEQVIEILLKSLVIVLLTSGAGALGQAVGLLDAVPEACGVRSVWQGVLTFVFAWLSVAAGVWWLFANRREA